MYDMIKKVEYCIIKMLSNNLDIYIDNIYNIKFTKEESNNCILIELPIKTNQPLIFSNVFNYIKINNYSYRLFLDTNIDNIIIKDKEKELFVTRYKKYLQPLKKLVIYLCIDNDNEYIYKEYKDLLKETIQLIKNKWR